MGDSAEKKVGFRKRAFFTASEPDARRHSCKSYRFERHGRFRRPHLRRFAVEPVDLPRMTWLRLKPKRETAVTSSGYQGSRCTGALLALLRQRNPVGSANLADPSTCRSSSRPKRRREPVLLIGRQAVLRALCLHDGPPAERAPAAASPAPHHHPAHAGQLRLRRAALRPAAGAGQRGRARQAQQPGVRAAFLDFPRPERICAVPTGTILRRFIPKPPAKPERPAIFSSRPTPTRSH